MRVTHQTLAATVLASLQNNVNKLGEIQQKLSSGKEISKPSDSPAGTGSSMVLRSEIAANRQYQRNAYDGLGWLAAQDTALTSTLDLTVRARGLVMQGTSTGSYSSPEAREALAAEIDGLREAAIGLANSTYLDRPVFGGTTTGAAAYASDGTYIGDTGQVMRSVGANTKVRVDSTASAVFGSGTNELFTVLKDIADHLRTAPASLQGDLGRLAIAEGNVQSGLSGIGARYNQVDRMRQAASDNVLNLSKSLSDIEDIDLPKTITELQLQQTAYQAALAAGARAVQPSLVDFLK